MMNKKRVLSIILMLALMIASTASGSVFDGTEKLSLELEAVPLPTVLSMIAQQNGLNLVLSGEVEGKVTLRLDNVDLETALNAILQPNGYNFYLNNDVIIVKPIENNAFGELTSEVVTLNYLDPRTASNALESLRSNKGRLVILDKLAEDGTGGRATGGAGTATAYAPNRIMLTDYPSVVEQMLTLIKEMDKPERLISIQVKIIETTLENDSKLGVLWPAEINGSLGAGTSSSESSDGTGSADLENVAAAWDPNNGNFFWGALSIAQVNGVLNMLEQNDNSKLISDPHITTLENHEAIIKIETVMPIPTVTRFTEGAATQDIQTFYDEEIGISLVVTPRINGDGKITLNVEPKVEDIIGFSGTQESQKPITTSRSIRTRITVADGQTAALGGLLKENVIESEQKVPLLGSIPLLGKWLFTSKSSEKTTSDLIILITPHILPD
ncbi:MAG: secretin and TonB N-terminal domain-containing protein [candidate division Zixibacteria bacterium]|nr:secretin and TonB N-terminal domain-containing protein [candidate division Zixibacteria bacterium]